MHKPNAEILRARHPIPTTEETLEKFGNREVLSKTDLQHWYHQLQLTLNLIILQHFP